MRLTAIGLHQFKCFKDLTISFAPLTLLTGHNAAGKSTVVQPLLLLAQSLRRGGKIETLDLNGQLVHLGTASEVLTRNPEDRTIRIGFHSGENNLIWEFDLSARGTSHFLEVTALYSASRGSTVHIGEGLVWQNDVDGRDPARIIDLIKETVFIGATRTGASEVFPMPEGGVVNADVGIAGQYAAWWYAENADEEVRTGRRHPHEEGITLRRQLDAYLSDLFPGAQVNAESVQRTPLTRLTFRTSEVSDWLRPANTGYGLTHAFPILLALLLAHDDQVIVIDSPEAHLHPRAQSNMGRILARFANAGVQIIVETHSDHIINGVRLAVSHGAISPQNASIHFFSRGRDGESTTFVSPRVGMDGSLSAWPDGFFDQAEQDLLALSGFND